MTIKVLISGITASKEVRKRQQRALLILDSLQVNYKAIDVTEAGNEADNRLLRENCKKREGQTVVLPPQFFTDDDEYLGDYEDFDAASDEDNALAFFRLAPPKSETSDVTNDGQHQPESIKGEAPTVELGMNGHTNGHQTVEDVAVHSDIDDASSSHDVHLASDHEPELERLGEDESDVEEEEVVAEVAKDVEVVEAKEAEGEEEAEDEDVEELTIDYVDCIRK